MRIPCLRYVATRKCHYFISSFVFVFSFFSPFPPPPPFFCSFCLFVFFFVFFFFSFLVLSHFTQVALPNTAPPPPAAQRCRSWAATPCSPPPAAFPPPQPHERPETGGFPLSVHPHSVPQPSPSSGEVSSHLPSLGDHVVESPNYYYCSSRVLYITGCPPPPQPFTAFILYTSNWYRSKVTSVRVQHPPLKEKTDLPALSFMFICCICLNGASSLTK